MAIDETIIKGWRVLAQVSTPAPIGSSLSEAAIMLEAMLLNPEIAEIALADAAAVALLEGTQFIAEGDNYGLYLLSLAVSRYNVRISKDIGTRIVELTSRQIERANARFNHRSLAWQRKRHDS